MDISKTRLLQKVGNTGVTIVHAKHSDLANQFILKVCVNHVTPLISIAWPQF